MLVATQFNFIAFLVWKCIKLCLIFFLMLLFTAGLWHWHILSGPVSMRKAAVQTLPSGRDPDLNLNICPEPTAALISRQAQFCTVCDKSTATKTHHTGAWIFVESEKMACESYTFAVCISFFFLSLMFEKNSVLMKRSQHQFNMSSHNFSAVICSWNFSLFIKTSNKWHGQEKASVNLIITLSLYKMLLITEYTLIFIIHLMKRHSLDSLTQEMSRPLD